MSEGDVLLMLDSFFFLNPVYFMADVDQDIRYCLPGPSIAAHITLALNTLLKPLKPES